MIVVVYIMIFIWMGFYSKIFNDSLEKILFKYVYY